MQNINIAMVLNFAVKNTFVLFCIIISLQEEHPPDAQIISNVGAVNPVECPVEEADDSNEAVDESVSVPGK